MSEAEDIRNEALRLLKSLGGLPLAEAMGIRRTAEHMLRMADLIDCGSIMTEQASHRELLTPES